MKEGIAHKHWNQTQESVVDREVCSIMWYSEKKLNSNCQQKLSAKHQNCFWKLVLREIPSLGLDLPHNLEAKTYKPAVPITWTLEMMQKNMCGSEKQAKNFLMILRWLVRIVLIQLFSL